MAAPSAGAAPAGDAPPTQQLTYKLVGDYMYSPEMGRIGKGSFAVVYKGRHTKMPHVEVAIKRISKRNLNQKHMENLSQEIAILKSMKHPNIVRLYDTQQTKDHIYLIMEFCAAGDLSRYIKKHRALSESTVKNFVQQIAAALQCLRKHAIIHRDLKPQNILLAPLGDQMLLKIADFGFARYLPWQGLAETLCGTPLYMAPEILESQQYDAKADLWSIGAIVYECLAGVPPFTAANHIDLLRVIKQTADSLKFPSNASPELVSLLSGLLRREPAARMSFDEFFAHPFVDFAHYAAEVLEPQLHPVSPSKTAQQPIPAASPQADRTVMVSPPAAPTTPSRATSEREFAATPVIPVTRKGLGDEWSGTGYVSPLATSPPNAPVARCVTAMGIEGGRTPAAAGVPEGPFGTAGRTFSQPLYPAADGPFSLPVRDARAPLTQAMGALDPSPPGPFGVLAQGLTELDAVLGHSPSYPQSLGTSHAGDAPIAASADGAAGISTSPSPTSSMQGSLGLRRGLVSSSGGLPVPKTNPFRHVGAPRLSPPQGVTAGAPASAPATTAAVPPPATAVPVTGGPVGAGQPGAPRLSGGSVDDTEYVFIDKDYVEINSFADVLNATPSKGARTAAAPTSTAVVQAPTGGQRSTSPPFAGLAQFIRGGGFAGAMGGRAQDVSPSTSPPFPTFAAAAGAPVYGSSPPFVRPTATAAMVALRSSRSFDESGSIVEVETLVRRTHLMMQLAEACVQPGDRSPPPARAAEALALYVKALSILQRGIGRLRGNIPQPVPLKMNADVQWLRERFNECLERAEWLKAAAVPPLAPEECVAERIMYDHAMGECQRAAMCEMHGRWEAAEGHYTSALCLLEALLDAMGNGPFSLGDVSVVEKFIAAVRKRMRSTMQKRSVTATSPRDRATTL